MDSTVKQCIKCIMPESYPGIYFNGEGVCNFCNDYKPYHKNLGKAKLKDLIDSQKQSGDYDCVVPLSGGKDSTYILFYTVRVLKLRPIAVSYDSGFLTRMAKENTRNACEILSVPLIVKKSPRKVQSKLLRESLLISQKVGYFTHFCGNCEVMLRSTSINVAKAYNVPFVFWGSSSLESGDNDNYESYRQLGKRKQNRLGSSINNIQSRLKVLLKNPQKIKQLPSIIYPYVGYHSIKYKIFSCLQRLRMEVPIKYALRPNSILPFTENTPKFIHCFDYIRWHSIRDTRILKEELKWRHPRNRESRFDCLLHCFDNYNSLKAYNMSSDGINFCNIIREKKMSREEAVVRENVIRESLDRECEKVIKIIGLTNYQKPS